MLTVKNIKDKPIDDELRSAKLKLWELKNSIGKSKNGKKHLSQKELQYFIDNYDIIPKSELSKKLNRSVSTLDFLAGELNLKTIYLADDEIVLHQLWLMLTGNYTDSYNQYLARKYGLPYRKNRGVYIINLPAFFDWLKDHIRLINCWHYRKGMLPIEPDWFLEKAEADRRADIYLYKRVWTAEEDKQLLDLVNQRKGYKEISFTLKRTGASIKRRCKDLNYSKPKRYPPKLWTEDEKNKLQELWHKGYQPCIIAEELNKSDRQVNSMLERYKYFGEPPEKFS